MNLGTNSFIILSAPCTILWANVTYLHLVYLDLDRWPGNWYINWLLIISDALKTK